jgi:glycosyltransferase involved in cell wall biosynthesis
MRIAYVAPYQSPTLLERRSILSNLGLAANVKIELIAELLRKAGHSIEIISQGEVNDRRARFYPAFREPRSFDPHIAVRYASSLPIKRVNGIWPMVSTLRLFRRQHRQTPYDLVIIYNLKLPQVVCGLYALKRLALPVVLEYEDDVLVDVSGKSHERKRWDHRGLACCLMRSVSACIGVSPLLLTCVPERAPKLLLRGVVGEHFLECGAQPVHTRRNWVVFSGTHTKSKGLEPLMQAWGLMKLEDWQLHIAGYGEDTNALMKMAQHDKSIVFHGRLDREQNAKLLSSAKIGINPHEVSATQGNVFAFKIIEYMAAGMHVVTTPMGSLEAELEAGVTYIGDNSPQTIAATLARVVVGRAYERTARESAWRAYGPEAVTRSLGRLLAEVMATAPPRAHGVGRAWHASKGNLVHRGG